VEDALEILVNEHKNILSVAEAVEKKCDVQAKEVLDEDFFSKTIDFIKNYADKLHHAKEEDILFKEFGKRIEEHPELAHCNPTEQMFYEHDLGRTFVKGMEMGLSEKKTEEIVKYARGYVDLIREHINKEDNIFYPMINSALTKETQESILNRFLEIDKEKKSEIEKYLKIVEEFKNRK